MDQRVPSTHRFDIFRPEIQKGRLPCVTYQRFHRHRNCTHIQPLTDRAQAPSAKERATFKTPPSHTIHTSAFMLECFTMSLLRKTVESDSDSGAPSVGR